ncbi:hypothetical protein HDU98_003649 [Podochytrium sp. JEL0797]|nr:hypothetical protein HDU98_003649 [Podochytrium sp. JEL0797]
MSSSNSTGNSLASFEAAIAFNGAMALAFFGLFMILRPRFPATYQSRILAGGSNLAGTIKQGTVSLFAAQLFSDTEMIASCGQDAFAAVFYVRTLAIFFILLGLPGAVILIPINAVGNSNTALSGLDLLTMANIGDQRWLWVHFFFVVYVVVAALYTIFLLLGQASELRTSYFVNEVKEGVAARTLMIRDVPKEWRNEETLTGLFNRVCPSGVQTVIIPKNIPSELTKLTQKHLKLRDSLESAISTYFSKIAKHLHLGCDPSTPDSLVGIMSTRDEFLVSGRRESRMPEGGSELPLTQNLTQPVSDNNSTRQKFRGVHRVPAIYGKKVDSIEKYALECREVEEEAGSLRDKVESSADAVGTVFVVFKKPYQARAMAKAIASDVPLVMGERVAHVKSGDVIWQNIDMGYFEREWRGLISKGIMFCMIIFWGALVALVLSFADLQSLGQRIPPFQNFLDNYPTPSAIIEGVLPAVIVAVLLSLVPPILRLLSVFAGSPLYSKTESDVLSQYFAFQLCNVFAVQIVGSSILTSFTAIENDPSSVMDILSSSIPKSANFFIQYLLVRGLTAPSGEILQLSRLILTPILVFLFGKTPRAVFNARRPPAWVYSTNLAVHGLAVTIGLVYSVIAPLILVFVSLYFFLYAVVYAYQLQFVYMVKNETETGGRFLFTAANHVFVGLFLMEFVCLALFLLNKNIGATALTAVLVSITYWAYRQAQSYIHVIDTIPIKSLMESEGAILAPQGGEPISPLIRFLFHGLLKKVEFAYVEVSESLGWSEEDRDAVRQLYSDPACGFKGVNVWIPKCGVWGVQAEVLREVCGDAGVGGTRVVTEGASVSDRGVVEVAEGLYDIMVNL